MKLWISGLSALFLLSCSSADPASSGDASSTEAREGLPDGLSGYKLTGETKNCVSTTRIGSTKVIDDQNIIFEIRGGDVYLNRLRGRCSGLNISKGFGYKLRSSQLCRGELITVLEMGGMGSTCSLGSFEELEELGEE